jgi:calcineurin-like phosphoesterase
MCGPSESCLGREIYPIVQRFLTNRPILYPVAKGPVKLHGAIIEIDEQTGRALHIERFARLYEPQSAPAATGSEGAPAAPALA